MEARRAELSRRKDAGEVLTARDEDFLWTATRAQIPNDVWNNATGLGPSQSQELLAAVSLRIAQLERRSSRTAEEDAQFEQLGNVSSTLRKVRSDRIATLRALTGEGTISPEQEQEKQAWVEAMLVDLRARKARGEELSADEEKEICCLLYTSPSPRD